MPHIFHSRYELSEIKIKKPCGVCLLHICDKTFRRRILQDLSVGRVRTESIPGMDPICNPPGSMPGISRISFACLSNTRITAFCPAGNAFPEHEAADHRIRGTGDPYRQTGAVFQLHASAHVQSFPELCRSADKAASDGSKFVKIYAGRSAYLCYLPAVSRSAIFRLRHSNRGTAQVQQSITASRSFNISPKLSLTFC